MNKLFVFVCFLFIGGCGRVDENVINVDKMPLLLSEIMRADATINYLSDKDSCVNANLIYDSIFKKYGTDKACFDSSLVYYSKDLEVYGRIYDSALKIIESERDSIEIDLNKKR